jgi:phosphoesterase RecJ-like protein
MTPAQNLSEIHRIVTSCRTILISGQGNPDGDSVGAQLALYDILTQQKQATRPEEAFEIVIANDEMPPALYKFLPGIDRIVEAESIVGRNFDVGFILDASTDRTGQVLPILQRCRDTINIDHHRTSAANTDTIAWVEPDKSSVCEMIYDFFEHPDWAVTVTPEIAACLYAGIIYDTGTFRYPSATARTLRIAASLLDTGIDFSRIVEQVLLEKSRVALSLLTSVLTNLYWDETGQIVVGTVSQQLWKQVGAQIGDEEGLITQYAFTKEAKVAVLLRELPSQNIKVSFRSRGALDVGQLAKTLHPKGGGHPRAAGCTLQNTLDDAQTRVIRALQKALE